MAKEGSGKEVPGLRIRAVRSQGFRRAGRQWGPEFEEVPVSQFKPDQVKALRAERNLIVQDCTIKATE